MKGQLLFGISPLFGVSVIREFTVVTISLPDMYTMHVITTMVQE